MAIDPLLPLVPENPLPDTTPPDQPNLTDPKEPPAAPVPPREAMPDEATSQPQLPENKPAMSGTGTEPPKPAEAEPDSPAVMPEEPAVKPEEVAALAKTLKAAHAAILNCKYDVATAGLDKVESLPKRPEHHAKYERLSLLAGYAKSFQSALRQAVAALRPGDEIKVGSNTSAGFVSAAKESITLRVAGANRSYPLDSLPTGLAVAIADRWLNKDDPVSLAMKGAYLATLKDLDEERKATARQWLEEASKKGVEGELHKVLDDTYDLEKDLKPE
jgi:hypothetical protein